MQMSRASKWSSIALCVALGSCSIAPQAIVRNATSSDILVWPLGERPETLRSGEMTKPILYSAHQRQQAFIKRGDCLYTYPAPDYFQLPKYAKNYASRVVVVIHEDMTLHAHERSKEGSEGPEILVAGFPLAPTRFCGRSD